MTASQSADPPNLRNLEQRADAEALISCLSSPKVSTRTQAAIGLARLGAPALESLILALRAEDPIVRISASRALQLLGTPAVEKLCHLLNSEDEDSRTDAALTLANMRSSVAIDSIIAALREGVLGRHYLDPLMESATGWRGVTDWYAWWDEHRSSWKYAGTQADHYIVRIQPPGAADVAGSIDEILAYRGYIRGAATIDFHLDSGMDDTYMIWLAFRRAESGHRRIDRQRSVLYDFGGRNIGKAYALFFRRTGE